MSVARGKPAQVIAKLPPWKVETLITDIDNVIAFLGTVPRNQQPMWPLHLYDFGKELRQALDEAVGDQ